MSLLRVTDLMTHFRTRRGRLRAVDGISFHIDAGETVGLVGESGCGKSTLGKTVTRLVDPTEGSILFKDREIARLGQRALRPYRRNLQMVFQDPFASLNPRHTVGEILQTPLIVHSDLSRAEIASKVNGIIGRVGLPPDAFNRYPHEFSGGQRQRIGIARALILDPELIVCDEPVSALDLSVQAQILNLLADLKQGMGLSYLFISHDLSVVRYFADRILVMYLGVIVESAGRDSLWRRPLHPYTRALIDAVPSAERRRRAAPILGDLPDQVDVPAGCRFHPRCPLATDICRVRQPSLETAAPGHEVACHHAGTPAAP